jgi:hypothetical protein
MPSEQATKVSSQAASSKSELEFFNTTEKITRQISLLTEYRTRLISDVVTGKVDVLGVVVPEYDRADAPINEELSADEDDSLSEILTGSEEDE